MTANELTATLCQTRTRTPLVTVDLPGVGADLTPAQLRALANVLVQIAADAERQPMEPRRYSRKQRHYPLTT